jgi:hypothetical protein
VRYMRLKKQEGIRLFKDIVFPQLPLDFLHNSMSKDLCEGVAKQSAT